MNRRKFVTNTGLETVGSSFGIHLLSQSAMATSFEFNSIQSLPENWDSPAINLNISKFNVETSNIDISNPLTITIKAGIGNTLAQVKPIWFSSRICNKFYCNFTQKLIIMIT